MKFMHQIRDSQKVINTQNSINRIVYAIAFNDQILCLKNGGDILQMIDCNIVRSSHNCKDDLQKAHEFFLSPISMREFSQSQRIPNIFSVVVAQNLFNGPASLGVNYVYHCLPFKQLQQVETKIGSVCKSFKFCIKPLCRLLTVEL